MVARSSAPDSPEALSPERSGLQRFVHFILAVAALAGLGVLATFPLAWQDQAILGGVLFVLAWAVNHFSKSRIATLTLVIISVFTTVRYLWWRFAETFSYLSYHAADEGWADLVFVALLLGAETYAFVILILGFFQSINPLERKPEPLPENVEDWPTVDLLIPTYNEPLSVLRPTVLAALNIDWPADKLRVMVLDDGCRDEIKDFAARAGAEYVGRVDSRYAKAGNINNTLRRTNGDLIAIFDCDHVPTRSFLQLTAGAFIKDEKLSMLQTPHHFFTPDPIERNLNVFRKIPNEGLLFYGVIQKGNDFWNATSFAGSCAVLRRTALEEIGGIAVETVTEDAHTSLRMQKRGWNTAFLGIPQAAGLAAFSLRDHVNQRIRWARGLTQILRIEKPLWSGELKWPQRLCYFNSAVHFLFALPRLIFLTAPLGFLLLDLSNFYGYVLAILAYAVPHLLLSTITNARLQGRHRNPYWNEIFESVLAPFILIPTTLALISPRKGIFNVTPKSMERTSKRYDWLMATPFLIIVALNLFGIGRGVEQILSGEGQFGTIAINIVWAVYSTLIIGTVLAVAEEPEEQRVEPRIPVRVPTYAVGPDGHRVSGETVDISYGGIRIESPDAAGLTLGEQTTIGFEIFGETLKLPGRIVRVEKWHAQVRFANLSLAQQESLTRVIFSRANAWVDWNDDHPDQFSAFKSFGQIFLLSLTGFSRVVRGMFRRKPEAYKPMTKVEADSEPALPLIAMLLAGGLLAAAPVAAQQTIDPADQPVAPIAEPATESFVARANASFDETHDLPEYGLKQPIVLQGPDALSGFRFWSPLTKVVEQASLDLRYQEAPALEENAGSLLVLLNGAEIAALPGGGRIGDGGARQATISLPAELFVGDNSLEFALDIPCAPQCADSQEVDAIWARIERTSTIRISGRRLPVARELRLLPMPFLDLSVHRAPEINIVTSPNAEPGELQAAGVVASWLGVLSDHRQARFASFVDRIPAGNAIVVATSDSPLAAGLGLAGRTVPSIALTENPGDPYGAVLAIIGPDAQALQNAAAALALGEYDAQGSIAEVRNFQMPSRADTNSAPRWLNPTEPILFTEFADPTELRVFDDSALDLYVRTPPDLDYGATRRLPLTLQYRVLDLPEDASATVTLFMNGTYIGHTDVSGSDEFGDEPRRSVFPIPVETIFPSSTLRVALQITKGDEESASYPMLEILGDSELNLTGYRRFAAMPRLDLFGNAGFPYSAHADLSETGVVLPANPGTDVRSMFFNWMGFLGANTGRAGLRVSVLEAQQAASVTDKDLLLIGEPGDSVFSPWASKMTVSLDRAQLDLVNDGTLDQWMRTLSWGGFSSERHELARALRAGQTYDVAVHGIEPLQGSRAVVALAVASPDAGPALVDALEDPARVGEFYGTFSLVSEGDVQSFSASPRTFYVGEPTIHAHLELWLRRFLWALPLLALGFAYLLARIFSVRLRSIEQRRLAGVQ